ncbi:MAG: hypothetical protein RSB41_03495, partial [Bacilli bacterium]
ASEVAFAGGKGAIDNTNYYLNIGNWYWTLSPFDWRSGGGEEISVSSNGAISKDGYSINTLVVFVLLFLSNPIALGNQETEQHQIHMN